MNKTAFIRGLEDAFGNYIEKSGSIPGLVKNQLKRKYPNRKNKNIIVELIKREFSKMEDSGNPENFTDMLKKEWMNLGKKK
jgi:DNA invertase Pin-like site-specific DNA recombinase